MERSSFGNGGPGNGPYLFALPRGSVIADRYTIDGVIGIGGFSILYRAFDRLLGGPVAVKEYFPNQIAERALEDLLGLEGDDRELVNTIIKLITGDEDIYTYRYKEMKWKKIL